MQTFERAKKAKEERERCQAKIQEMTESLEKEKSSYSKLWEELDKVAKGKYEVTVVNQHIQQEKEHIEQEYNTAQNIARKLRTVLLQNKDESGDETEFAVRRLTMMAKQCQKMMLQKLSCLEDQKVAIMKARRLEQANILANINKDKKISMALIGEKECDRVIKMADSLLVALRIHGNSIILQCWSQIPVCHCHWICCIPERRIKLEFGSNTEG